jgi:multidrug efflux pump subunit AcrA (membrane-fusion protein)
MKRTLIITGIIAAVIVIALVIFNRVTSAKDNASTFTEVKEGVFEITVSNSGELLAEKSFDIMGPEISPGNDDHGPGQGGRGGSQGGHGGMRAMHFKIQDIVPEGTIVKKGDYVAQIDRTDYDNTLKDELQNLTTLEANLEMKILDTAVILTDLRDEIRNQKFVVEQAEITLAESKYEPPATIRQAEINLNKALRELEQQKMGYALRQAQTLKDIRHQQQHYNEGKELVAALQEFLTKFTITAPSDGIVIYKKEWNGTKRKTGSTVNPFDRIIASIPDLSSMISKTYVSEIEVNRVKTGQKVSITVDALPGKTFTGTVTGVANIGEVLPNSDAKMFEVLAKIDGSDNSLRPAMTTWNRIIIKTIDDAIYIPAECVNTGSDSIPYVIKKNKTRQIVVLGDLNEKNVVVRQGLEPGTSIYVVPPEESSKFKLVGENLIQVIREGR